MRQSIRHTVLLFNLDCQKHILIDRIENRARDEKDASEAPLRESTASLQTPGSHALAVVAMKSCRIPPPLPKKHPVADISDHDIKGRRGSIAPVRSELYLLPQAATVSYFT